MHYMILNYTPPSDFADAEAVAVAAEGAVWGANLSALIEAGVFVSGNARHPLLGNLTPSALAAQLKPA